MKIKHFALTTGMAIVAPIASGAITSASAFTIFFGEDDANGNINAIPNSKAQELAFLSNIKPTGGQTEGFEGIMAGGSNTTALPGSVGAQITATNAMLSGVSNIPYGGTVPGFPNITNSRFPIGGTQYYEVGTSQGLTTTTITFDKKIAAFGFYATDLENAEGIKLQLNDSANTLQTIKPTANGKSGAALYYGLIADPNQTFDSITLSLITPVSNPNKLNDRFGLDNLTFATFDQLNSSTPVPEPFTIIGTLVGGTAALRMRKKLKSTSKD